MAEGPGQHVTANQPDSQLTKHLHHSCERFLQGRPRKTDSNDPQPPILLSEQFTNGHICACTAIPHHSVGSLCCRPGQPSSGRCLPEKTGEGAGRQHSTHKLKPHKDLTGHSPTGAEAAAPKVSKCPAHLQRKTKIKLGQKCPPRCQECARGTFVSKANWLSARTHSHTHTHKRTQAKAMGGLMCTFLV